MSEELKKYQDLVTGLMQKLDAERQRASRLEHELSQYREGKSLADRLAEKDYIINRQKRTIDKLNAQLDWLKRKVSHRLLDLLGKILKEIHGIERGQEDAENLLTVREKSDLEIITRM